MARWQLARERSRQFPLVVGFAPLVGLHSSRFERPKGGIGPRTEASCHPPDNEFTPREGVPSSRLEFPKATFVPLLRGWFPTFSGGST